MFMSILENDVTYWVRRETSNIFGTVLEHGKVSVTDLSTREFLYTCYDKTDENKFFLFLSYRF